MGRFGAKVQSKIPMGALVSLVIGLVIVGAFLISSKALDSANSVKQMNLLEDSVERSVTQCYALEGAYPANIFYLEDHYGLTYDEERYFIDYTYIGANLRPDITIIER